MPKVDKKRPRIEMTHAQLKARAEFKTALRNISGPRQLLAHFTDPPIVTIRNDIDGDTPQLSFKFIDEYVIGEGVQMISEAFMSGCTCQQENGNHCGCEYTKCECLSQMNQASRGFPYYVSQGRKGTLREKYLDTRYAIFECNSKCNCGSNCKNKVVQWGRQVPLEIFKTTNRGWGLRALADLRKGEFVDVYKGEIIPLEEADKRAKQATGKDIYLYSLDKFCEDNWEMCKDRQYVVDGEFYAGPTRFINHSCAPNLRQFTVSYNHADPCIYDLAFFALEPIKAGTELTFDYLDKDETDDETKGEEEETEGKKRIKCLCGAARCRKWLWF
ncbi:MAG: hypothetical protein M1829_002604 [Trizodia sp. TS-e1964]|nr:MAG: hypothetical protein M1829_002604 [Trizodia sp. TS-e1964]